MRDIIVCIAISFYIGKLQVTLKHFIEISRYSSDISSRVVKMLFRGSEFREN